MTDVDRNTDSASPGAIAASTPAQPTRRQINWLQAAAHVAEIVGVVVVIASLFFLSAQVQQNTTQLRRADLNATHEHWSAVRLFLAGNRDHAAFWSDSLNGAELDPPDQLRFSALMTEHARIAFQIWDRNRSIGIESGDFARSAAPPLARLLCTAGGGRWWTQFRREFPRDFVEEMNAALASMLAGPGSSDPAHPCVDPNAPPPPAVQNG